MVFVLGLSVYEINTHQVVNMEKYDSGGLWTWSEAFHFCLHFVRVLFQSRVAATKHLRDSLCYISSCVLKHFPKSMLRQNARHLVHFLHVLSLVKSDFLKSKVIKPIIYCVCRGGSWEKALVLKNYKTLFITYANRRAKIHLVGIQTVCDLFCLLMRQKRKLIINRFVYFTSVA